jgi:hypothetical protein
MDADDICFPDRFAKQVKFLEENEEYVICGTSAYRFNSRISDRKPFNPPITDEHIRVRLFFNSSFIHPSVMFRTSTVKENYLKFSNQYKYAEDYYFWMDILKYGKGFNLKEKLMYYRVVETSQTAVGNSNLESRKRILGNIHKRYMNDYDISFSDKELELNFYLTNTNWMRLLDLNTFSFFYIGNFLKKIIYALDKKGMSKKVIYEEVGRVYFSLVYVKKIKVFNDKNFLKNLNFLLLWSGGLGFLKDRIVK